MDSSSNSHHLPEDFQGIPRLNSVENSDHDELFISIYRKEQISLFFSEFLINTVCIEILGLFLVGFILEKLKYYFFMGFWIFHDWGSSVFLIHRLMIERNKKIRVRIKGYLAERMLILIYKVMIIAYLENDGLYSSFSNIPLIFFAMVRIMLYFSESYSMDANSFNDCLVIGLRLYLLIQNIILNVKIDKWVNWSWKEIFWSYWVFFSVTLGMDVSILMMIFNRFCMGFFEEMNTMEVKALLWVFLLISRLAASSCLLVMGLIDYLDYNQDNTLFIYIYFSISSSFLFTMVSFYFKQDVLRSMKKIYNSNETDRSLEPGSQDLRNNNINGNMNNKKISSEIHHIESKTFSIPRFLLKFSSTYFKRTSEKNPKEPPYSNSSRKAKKILQNSKKKSQKVVSLHKKSNSMENREFMKFLYNSNNNAPVIEGFKKLSTEFTTTLNTHTLENGNNTNTFITIQNNENEEEEKKTRQIPLNSGKMKEKSLSVNEKLYVVNDLKDENFHHFPKEITIKNAMNLNAMRTTQSDLKLPFGNRRKRLGFRTKSLQIITDEGIIESTTERKIKNMIKDPLTAEEMKDSKESSTTRHAACLVCCEKIPNAVLMECGHGGICYECGVELLKKLGECPLCRKKIEQVYKIDLEDQKKKYIRVVCSAQLKTYSAENKFEKP